MKNETHEVQLPAEEGQLDEFLARTGLAAARPKVVQIACGAQQGGGHLLYALTEDGRVWSEEKGEWFEVAPILDGKPAT
jgi:hypothetical protein